MVGSLLIINHLWLNTFLVLLTVGLPNGLIIEFLIYVTVKWFDKICIVNMYSFNHLISSSMDVATTDYVPLHNITMEQALVI